MKISKKVGLLHHFWPKNSADFVTPSEVVPVRSRRAPSCRLTGIRGAFATSLKPIPPSEQSDLRKGTHVAARPPPKGAQQERGSVRSGPAPSVHPGGLAARNRLRWGDQPHRHRRRRWWWRDSGRPGEQEPTPLEPHDLRCHAVVLCESLVTPEPTTCACCGPRKSQASSLRAKSFSSTSLCWRLGGFATE